MRIALNRGFFAPMKKGEPICGSPSQEFKSLSTKVRISTQTVEMPNSLSLNCPEATA